jgi:hypothetical protein
MKNFAAKELCYLVVVLPIVFSRLFSFRGLRGIRVDRSRGYVS